MAGAIQNAMELVFGKPAPVAAVVPVPVGTGNPAPTNLPADPPAPPAPLEKFSKLWETTPVDPKNVPAASFLDGITPETVSKAAGTVSFQKAMTPERLATISKGGEAGIAAMMEAVNEMSQDVYAKSALASTEILRRGLKEQQENFLKDLPKHIRDNAVRGISKTKDPIFSNAALKPVVTAIEAQMATKFPEAGPEEIAGMVVDYFGEIAKAASKTPTKNESSRADPSDIDWDKFASE